MKAHLKGKCILAVLILIPVLMCSQPGYAFDYLTYHMEKLMFSYDTVMANKVEGLGYTIEWTFVSKDEFDEGDQYWYNAAIQKGSNSYNILVCFVSSQDRQQVQGVILYCDIDKDKSPQDEMYFLALDGLMKCTLLLSNNPKYLKSFDQTLSDMWGGAQKAVETDGEEGFSITEESILSINYITIDDPTVDGCLEIMLYY